MYASLDSIITLLRLWAEGLATAPIVASRLRQLQNVDVDELKLALALLAVSGQELPALARDLAQLARPEVLTRLCERATPYPVLGQQIGIELAKAASMLHSEPKLAFELYEHALQLMPELGAAWFFRGLLWQAQGHWQQAAADLVQACRLQPDWLPAWQEAARSLLMAGQAEQALQWVEQGLIHLPEQAPLWMTRGNLWQAVGQLAEAEASYRRSLELDPSQAGVWSNLGLVCQQALRPAEAEEAYRRALALNPGLAELWNNLATLHLEKGDLKQADQCLGQCLQVMPAYYPAWVNRGLLAAVQEQPDMAAQLFAQARQIDSRRGEAWLEAAGLLLELRRTDEAFELLEQARLHMPWPGQAEIMLGRALAIRHQPVEAEVLMRSAIEREPDRLFWRFVRDLGAADLWFCQPRPARDAYLSHLQAVLPKYAANPFPPEVYLQETRYLPPETLWSLTYLDDRPVHEIKRLLGNCFTPGMPRPQPVMGQGPLQVGVVVTPGHEGIFFKLAAPLLAALHPEACEVVLLGDPRRLAGCGLNALPLAPRVAAAADQIRSLQLDLLYYWEVGSDALNFFLPYFQPAPVQFTSWGTPATTGNPCIQYYLSSSKQEADDAAEYYTETLLLMDDLPVVFEDPEPASGNASRQQLGLPADGTLYFCLHNPLKLGLDFVQLLARILAADPTGQLLLLTSRQSWINASLAPARDLLAPFSDRVHWRESPVPRAEYLNLIKVSDIGLDTLPYSGGQVSQEALALGLPMITLPGPAGHSRLTLGRWNQLGLDDGVAADPDDYVRRALALSANPAQRAALRAELLTRRHLLIQRREAVDQFIFLLWEMARREGLRA